MKIDKGKKFTNDENIKQIYQWQSVWVVMFRTYLLNF